MLVVDVGTRAPILSSLVTVARLCGWARASNGHLGDSAGSLGTAARYIAWAEEPEPCASTAYGPGAPLVNSALQSLFQARAGFQPVALSIGMALLNVRTVRQ